MPACFRLQSRSGRAALRIAIVPFLLHGAVFVPVGEGASRRGPNAPTARHAAAFAARTATHAPRPEAFSIDRYLKTYERLVLDPKLIASQVRTTGEIPIATDSLHFDLALEPHDMRAPGYRAQVMLDGGVARPLDPDPVRTYAGTVRGRADSHARFTIDDESVEGLILVDDEAYYVEPLGGFSPSAGPADFILYKGSDVNQDADAACGATLAGEVREVARSVAGETLPKGPPGHLVVELATEADYEYVSRLGGASRAIGEILSIMNQVDGIYSAQLGISFLVGFQNAWVTEEDPYRATAAGYVLGEFSGYWNERMGHVRRDLAHMWTGKDMDGSEIGMAWVGVVCASPVECYGLSQLWYADQKIALTAHEIGHNFGASHPIVGSSPDAASCVLTIMAPYIGTQLVFCTLSRDEIRAHLAADSSCLLAAAEGCHAVVPLESWKGEYFANPRFEGSPATVRDEGRSFLDVDTSREPLGSACGISAGRSSVRWTRLLGLGAGTYRFTLAGSGTLTLFVDDVMVAGMRPDQAAVGGTVDVALEAGEHLVRCELAGHDAAAAAAVFWTRLEPTAPSDLSAVRRGRKTAVLRWADNSDNEDGFVIAYLDSSGRWQDIMTVAPGVTSAKITGLVPRAPYTFSVRAFNTYGPSEPATQRLEIRRTQPGGPSV